MFGMKAHYKPRIRTSSEVTDQNRLDASLIVKNLCDDYPHANVALILDIPLWSVETIKHMRKSPYYDTYMAPEHVIRRILAWKVTLEAAEHSIAPMVNNLGVD